MDGSARCLLCFFQDRIGEAATELATRLPPGEARLAANDVAAQLAARVRAMEGVELMTSFGAETAEDFQGLGQARPRGRSC